MKLFLEPEDYESSRADYFGEPESAERLWAICKCLAQPLHSWQGKKQFREAVRHRVQDLDYCRANLYSPEMDRLPDLASWVFPTEESDKVSWAFQ